MPVNNRPPWVTVNTITPGIAMTIAEHSEGYERNTLSHTLTIRSAKEGQFLPRGGQAGAGTASQAAVHWKVLSPGDKVRALHSAATGDAFQAGDLGVVDSVAEDGTVKVAWERTGMTSQHEPERAQQELEMIPVASALQPGDIVKATTDGVADGVDHFGKGDRGIVQGVEVDSGEEYVHIFWERTGQTTRHRAAAYADDVEVVEKAPTGSASGLPLITSGSVAGSATRDMYEYPLERTIEAQPYEQRFFNPLPIKSTAPEAGSRVYDVSSGAPKKNDPFQAPLDRNGKPFKPVTSS
mmetsp:Transcript_26306/g.63355  ORF Transcript_26306/g.63355 Transcript_26306/m.63355 type:complete len:296 (+) Transcript_26306:32-919(+)